MYYKCKDCGEEYPYDIPKCKVCNNITFKRIQSPKGWWTFLKEEEKNVILFLEGNPELTSENLEKFFRKYEIDDTISFSLIANITKKNYITPLELKVVQNFIKLVSLKSSFAHRAHVELREML